MMMRASIRHRFKEFNHDILFQFFVNTHIVSEELSYLKSKNTKLKAFQVCYVYILIEGRRKRIAFSPQWPVLIYETGVVEELSGKDRHFVRWRDTAFDIINSRLRDFRGMILRDETDKHNFNDLEEIRESFIPWEINQIKNTGDVKEGAEIVFQTEQGKALLDGEQFVSNRLKKNITESIRYKDNMIKEHIKSRNEIC